MTAAETLRQMRLVAAARSSQAHGDGDGKMIAQWAIDSETELERLRRNESQTTPAEFR